ncbi:MAG: hypothetical protein IT165_08895 [Bryobacterales bacterium]|nr:hypothetical protein [Bryobacterales bacterium]
MADQAVAGKQPTAPVSTWAPLVILAWLVPGGGHFYLKKTGRGILLAAAITLTFLFGIMMRGAMFHPMTGDLLTTIIYCGGFVGDMASGILYLLTSWLGYNQPEVAGHVHDYGTKFLVAAGLLNVLAMVDVFEIVSGRKD